jgi:nucleoside-triphosphatase THEP1
LKKDLEKIKPIWVQAAFLGSMWGSIEIIIGSFLHNLRLPFTGTILSAIGVALLIGGHYIWNEKGLVWRAGVVCALMKSISPSAVIIGPMIGIMSEAFVIELFLHISGRSPIGMLVGGAVATCLPFIQNILNLVITFGFNVTYLYVELYKFIVRNLGIERIGPYEAIGLLFLIYAIFGVGAASLGIIVGKKVNSVSWTPPSAASIDKTLSLQSINPSQKFSLASLLINIISIPIILFIVSELSLLWSSSIVVGYIIVSIFLYPISWKRFSRPKIWIELFLISILAGFLLGEMTNHHAGWSWSGLLVGVQMVLRASYMIVVFNIISIELRNPKIINWFFKMGFGQLSFAMEIAFDALPTMISFLGDQRNVILRPILSLSRLLQVVKYRLNQFEQMKSVKSKIYILTGRKGAGKTTLLAKYVRDIQNKNITVGGILSPAVYQDLSRIGYDVVNIKTNAKTILCRSDSKTASVKIGDFAFSEEGLLFGNEAIPKSADCNLIVIDEVGPLELSGKGWASSLDLVMNNASFPLLLVVRENILEKIRERWKFIPDLMWNLDNTESDEILSDMIKVIVPDQKNFN